MVSHKSSIYKLKGVIKKYDWGGTEFLSRLLSFSNPGKETLAEYWLGAHDLSSSVLITGKGEIKLNDFISGVIPILLPIKNKLFKRGFSPMHGVAEII